jgi:hypothetical protein
MSENRADALNCMNLLAVCTTMSDLSKFVPRFSRRMVTAWAGSNDNPLLKRTSQSAPWSVEHVGGSLQSGKANG